MSSIRKGATCIKCKSVKLPNSQKYTCCASQDLVSQSPWFLGFNNVQSRLPKTVSEGSCGAQCKYVDRASVDKKWFLSEMTHPIRTYFEKRATYTSQTFRLMHLFKEGLFLLIDQNWPKKPLRVQNVREKVPKYISLLATRLLS